MKIRAAVSRRNAPHPEIEDLDIAEPEPGEIMLRIAACGICHTDLKAHEGGTVRTPKPIVLGHEGAGFVERIGDGVNDFGPGDPVLLAADSCGQCRNCRRHLPGCCEEAMQRNFGGLRPDRTTPLSRGGARVFAHFFGQSSFAQYAIVSARNAVRVPGGIALETLAPLACGVSTGAGAVLNALAVRAGDTIAVFGTGAVGLSAIMAARLAGASSIIAVDRLAARLDLARELGATDAIDVSQGNVIGSIRGVSPRGVDFTLNTTESPEIFAASIACLAMGGCAGFVAAPGEDVAVPVQTMLTGGRSLRAVLGCHAPPQDFIPRLIDHFLAGRFPFDRLITRYPFADIAEAFDDAAAGRAIKPVLVM